MIVHADDDVAVAGEHLGIPPEVPAVDMRRMRASVNRVQQRPLFARVEIGRVRDPDLDGLPAPTAYRQLTRRAESNPGKQRAVETFDRPLAAAVGIEREQRRRMGVRGAIDDDTAAVARQRKAGDHSATRYHRRHGIAKPEPVESLPAMIFDKHVKRRGVGRPGMPGRAAIES